ncbi:hypothetical protein [Pedobacter heparinus]|uniref:Uncharacterized protein n=1 Tax=Pedobacter heparinus (strain ATCC 13125 / DSM 2366 / CIP 104194 / JCM 7457 / NBRC 12017 / NCIMB 9290 / NRRL B-14731 / HIM 762-3) TaxID=485917 RepID=C6Y1I1_PEDHD|nr:hypothetical protein [Pedobacter heparinus]ACU02957.1 hypothetical protein Phep_0735 [Pedobacter heparinus DSM 2366]
MMTGPNDEKGAGKATDKLHPMNLGETKDFENLSYDKDKNSFEFDVRGKDEDYDHPLPYDTSAPNGEDSISTYDESNPYIGTEYDNEKEMSERLDGAGMRIDNNGESIELSPEDEILSRTPEDDREDLDEEGYPVNDKPGR